VIPLVIEKEKMERARAVAGDTPLLRLVPLKAKKYGVVTTGSEVFHGRITDQFTPVLQAKLAEYGCEMIAHEILDDDHEAITAAIRRMLDGGCELVLCTGGMSVDPDDRTPLAIKNTGARIVSYGAPVLPGAMFLVAYTEDGRPVCGLPGCIMYAKRTVFDLVLPRLLADVPITAPWLAGLGNGGLCLNCAECHFPNCGFGKGV
ncbi:MAG: molybdopterin-binding protein, partial [Gemmiger sp.]